MQLNEKIETLTDSLKEYADTNYELIKLEVIDQSSSIISGIVATLIVMIILILFAFFGSMYVAFYLSDFLGIDYIGFALVAGFYLLVALLIYFNKKDVIEKHVYNSFVEKWLNAKPRPTTE